MNLLVALYAKDTWDDEANYYFYRAGAAITRQEVKLEYSTDTEALELLADLRNIYQDMATQRCEEGGDRDPYFEDDIAIEQEEYETEAAAHDPELMEKLDAIRDEKTGQLESSSTPKAPKPRPSGTGVWMKESEVPIRGILPKPDHRTVTSSTLPLPLGSLYKEKGKLAQGQMTLANILERLEALPKNLSKKLTRRLLKRPTRKPTLRLARRLMVTPTRRLPRKDRNMQSQFAKCAALKILIPRCAKNNPT